MTADDCAALTNIQCFGNCFSTENPKMKEAAIKAVESYNEENPSFWDTVKGWFGIQPKEKKIDPSKEMLAQCICECVPKITAQYWDCLLYTSIREPLSRRKQTSYWRAR